MATNTFIILFIILSTVSSLLTEAIKKGCQNVSSNLLAIISALVVGGGGSVAAYIWLSIPFTSSSIVAIVAMIFCIAVGSMVGYDKVIQTLNQIKGDANEIRK